VIRTIISLDSQDKQWLARKARRKRTTIAALVRDAVRRARAQDERQAPSLDGLLAKTSGLRSGSDGLAEQQALRDEWS